MDAVRKPHPASPRQLEIAQLAADGLTNQQIAGRLGISAHTVRRQMFLLYMRLGVHDRAHMVATLMRQGTIR